MPAPCDQSPLTTKHRYHSTDRSELGGEVRKIEQRHSTLLTTNVRAFDNVENPSTLEGRLTFDNGFLKGSWTQLTHSTQHLELTRRQISTKKPRWKNSPSLITTCTSPRLPCLQSTTDLYTVRVKTIESKITIPPHTKAKSVAVKFDHDSRPGRKATHSIPWKVRLFN